MNEINYNHKRPYKNKSNSELHQIKDDTDIRQAHRSLAEAEISYRQGRLKKLGLIIAVIGLVATLIYYFGPWMVNLK